MKKLTASFMALALAFGLAACGSTEASVSSTSQETASPSTEAQASVPESSGVESAAEESSPQESTAASEEANAASGENAASEETSSEDTAEAGKTLVVYFSATGNTERVAEVIAETTGGELFQLEPVEPYTDEDLNYNDENSRVSQEYADESLRDVELVADTVDDWQDVDTVYIGYPVWWGIAAWPVNTFVEANDFTGKTVIPFCTSASSGLGESGELLAELAGTGDWQEGMRFRSSVSEEDVAAWVESLE
ncbi:MAG TPA: flavodoxin [Candidatus Acetatifactor stercoripullorum]|uniref:Flavodoxin n=1 Tax=Candidatus Acetatifactor stercoripullorum TaxID=2838414 RepID=A0A9D1R552_9FIRM|nr:flavodoxin [uncultured Acetatifactor sp.]HIW81160.1 flavodoxin [Candidatus Acetatifactor stercoripullorum]